MERGPTSDGSSADSQSVSTGSTDEGPAATRRRTNLKGSFSTVKRSRQRKQVRPSKVAKEQTSLPHAGDEHESGQKQFLDVTLTPKPESDNDPEADLSDEGPTTSLAREVNGIGYGRSNELTATMARKHYKEAVRSRYNTHSDTGSEKEIVESIDIVRGNTSIEAICNGCSFENKHGKGTITANINGSNTSINSRSTETSTESSESAAESVDFDADNDESEHRCSQGSTLDIVEMYDCALDDIREERKRAKFALTMINISQEEVAVAIVNVRKVLIRAFGSSATLVEVVLKDFEATGDAEVPDSLDGLRIGISQERRFVDLKAFVCSESTLIAEKEADDLAIRDLLAEFEKEQILILASTTERDCESLPLTYTVEANYKCPEPSTNNELGDACQQSIDHPEEPKNLDRDETATRSVVAEACKSARKLSKKINSQYKLMTTLTSIANRRQEKTKMSFQTALNCAVCMGNMIGEAMKAKHVALEELRKAGEEVTEMDYVQSTSRLMSKLIDEAITHAEAGAGYLLVIKQDLEDSDTLVDNLMGKDRIAANIDREATTSRAAVEKLLFDHSAAIGEKELWTKVLEMQSMSSSLSTTVTEVERSADTAKRLAFKSAFTAEKSIHTMLSITRKVVEAISASVDILNVIANAIELENL